MGMPVTLEVLGEEVRATKAIEGAFDYFEEVDQKFSTYKEESEISRINRGELASEDESPEMKEIFRLSEETKKQTNGYFDIRRPDGKYDPSGIVKGWAIRNAAWIIKNLGFEDFYVDAGGDIQVSGKNAKGEKWSVGIRDPRNQIQIVKTVYLSGGGIATSGTYIRGQHIYDPKDPSREFHKVLSLTVVGPDIYEADRFATAAFAMDEEGIKFIEGLEGFEGYQIGENGVATMTSGFERYTNA